MRIGLLAASAVLLATAVSAADSAMAITRSMFVETRGADGVSLEPADRLEAGDKVVLMMQWRGREAHKPFTLASHIPEALAFQRSGDPSVEISIDGGRRWGRLGELRSEGRFASPEEVTNLRWRIAADDARGLRSYSAIVR